jgi:signal transduction histidine kinase/CheY-like chemotaxis protein
MQTEKYLELKAIYETLHDEKEKINCLIDIVHEIRSYDFDQALQLSEDIIERSKKIKYKEGEGRGLNHKGACYWLKGEYENGLTILREAQTLAKNIKNDSLKARIYNNFGNIYRDLGDLTNAIKYYSWALEINEELNDEISQSVALINISNLHVDLQEYDNALEYAIKCMNIFEKHDDKSRLVNVYHTLGNIYFKKDDNDNALRFFKKSLHLTEPYTVGHMLANSGLGKVYYNMKKYNEARNYLQTSLAHSENISNIEGIIIAEFYLGRLHIDEEKYQEALMHFHKAFDIANEHSRKHDVMSIHELLAFAYEKTNDIPKAYENLKAFEKLKEEIFQQNAFSKLRNLQLRHEMEFAYKEKEVAEHTAQLKQQFIANMSHEIRTPMNAIVGMTRLLMEKKPLPEQQKYLKAISVSADNLLVIVNDILDFSKIEAGKISIEHIEFSLKESLKNAVNILKIKAEEKGLNIRFEIEENLPHILLGAPTRLNQILLNLAGNAVKFTEKGSVHIMTRSVGVIDNNVKIAFDIIDTGIGISEEYVSKIFESFTQAGTDVARKFGGTGLGLTISKQLVELMNGTIEVHSKINEGTTFTFTIPFEIANEQVLHEEKEFHFSEKDKNKLNNTKILLVEDNEFNRMLAIDTLHGLAEHMQLDEAYNGAEAIEKIKNNSYDIVLMDIQMPIMNGLDATLYIRNELKDNSIIIAMTANVMQQDIKSYLQAGMNDHIPKPFKKEELIFKLLKYSLASTDNINFKEIDKHVYEEDTEAWQNQDITNLNFLTSFTSGNSEKKKKYISMYLQNTPLIVNQLKKAFKEKDRDSIKINAHTLKSQLGYMGIQEAVSKVLELEKRALEIDEVSLEKLIENLDKVCLKSYTELQKELS